MLALSLGSPERFQELSRPSVSVLMSSHNYARFLGDAVRSVLDQTYADFELIVQDDGSTDGSADLLHQLARDDDRVTVVTRSIARGQSASLNDAFERSRGAIISYLDADDLFHPRKLEMVVGLLSSGEAGLAIHPVQVVDEDRVPLQIMPLFSSLSAGWIADEVIARGGRWRTVPSSALSFRRELASSIFPIPPQLITGADGFTSMLAPLLTPVVVSGEPLTEYRVHGANSYGTRVIRTETATRALSEIETITQLVNDRLVDLGRVGIVLDHQDNLLWHQNRYIQSALTPSGLASRAALLAALLPRLWRDDLSSIFMKVSGSVLYPVALVLSRSVRFRWLSLGLGVSKFKQVVAKATRAVR